MNSTFLTNLQAEIRAIHNNISMNKEATLKGNDRKAVLLILKQWLKDRGVTACECKPNKQP